MASVRSALTYLGVSPSSNASVLRNLCGFNRNRAPTDPDPSTVSQVSLLNHLNSLKGKHVHVNVIRVGIDNATDADLDKIDYAIYRARNIYRTVSLGLGRVEHYAVPASDANGRDDLGSQSEAEDLTHDWSVPNNGIDLFIVRNISATDFIGISPVGGPCDKNDKNMNGVISGHINLGTEQLARTFSHEMGHYLGLKHNHGDNCPSSAAERDNLMAQSRCANSVRNSVILTGSQGNTIRGHCFVRDGY
jgi:hypothetical protein